MKTEKAAKGDSPYFREPLPLRDSGILAASYKPVHARAAKPSYARPGARMVRATDKHRQYCWERPEASPNVYLTRSYSQFTRSAV
jgi:hypothetical protein